MRDASNIREIESLGVHWMGFIFHPRSPRFVAEMPGYLPDTAKRIGVFVNENKQTIATLADRFSLDYVQLHGNESPTFCQNLQQEIKVIKAFAIKKAEDIRQTTHYEGVCDFFLFDNKCEQYGGSGNQFDWEILKHYTGNTPFLLSGGINRHSAPALARLSHHKLIGYDINSRFEKSAGIKDAERIKDFINQLNNKEQ